MAHPTDLLLRLSGAILLMAVEGWCEAAETDRSGFADRGGPAWRTGGAFSASAPRGVPKNAHRRTNRRKAKVSAVKRQLGEPVESIAGGCLPCSGDEIRLVDGDSAFALLFSAASGRRRLLPVAADLGCPSTCSAWGWRTAGLFSFGVYPPPVL